MYNLFTLSPEMSLDISNPCDNFLHLLCFANFLRSVSKTLAYNQVLFTKLARNIKRLVVYSYYFLLETNKPIIVRAEPMVPIIVIFSFKKIAAKKIVITGIR